MTSSASPARPRAGRRSVPRSPEPVRSGISGDLVVLGLAGLAIAGVVLTLRGTELTAGTRTVLMLGLLLLLVPPLVHRLHEGRDLSVFLILPSVLSAAQNLYLLIAAEQATEGDILVALTLNFVLAVVLLACLLLARRPSSPGLSALTRRLLVLAVALTVWGFVTAGLFGVPIGSALASYRNVMTAVLFTLLGLLAAHLTSVPTYLRYVVALGWAVMAFGLWEEFNPSFWTEVPLAALWELKGLYLNEITELPGNFYGTNVFGGDLVRRMASSFADPVNLGSFLFVVFAVAWFTHRRVAMIVAGVCIFFAFSKGAMLGVLIFATFWSRHHTHRLIHLLVLVATVVAGLGFLTLATGESGGGSTGAHIAGFTTAIADLPAYPLGHGMGNAGTLAGRMGAESESATMESGVGMIISQFGIPGLLLFVAIFWCLIRAASRLTDQRERTLALTLLVGFLANAAFNEVALSPNSSAIYFVVAGLLIGRQLLRDDELERSPA